MNSPEVGIIMVAYSPNTSMLSSWSEAVRQGVPLRIWDNTPQGFGGWMDYPNLVVYSSGSNIGLGPAIKCLLTKLQAESQWVNALYFDQDADWSALTYRWVVEVMKKNSMGLGSKSPQLIGIRGGPHPTNPVKVRTMFTNGMIFPVGPVLKLMNRYQPYFLECVDYQLCYKANLSGWSLFQIDGCPELFHDASRPFLELKIGSNIYRKRIYPPGRSRRFLLNLGALSMEALFRFDFNYLWVFLRNVLTHLAYRTWFDALWYLRPSVRQT